MKPKDKELNWIRQKIQECEEELKKSKISMATSDGYIHLFEIHTELWKLLYFKLNQEETFLLK